MSKVSKLMLTGRLYNRREAIFDGALTLLFSVGAVCACGAQTNRTRRSFGCYVADEDLSQIYPAGTDTRVFITGNEPMIPRSGDQDFDLALAQTLAKVSQIFDVSPGFAYYDDYDGLNAYASPRVRLNGADGTVLFGQRLLQRLRTSPDSPEVSVAAVCAHEFGHVLQFKSNLYDRVRGGQPTVKRPELQADFLAGYFAGIRKRERPSFPAAVFAMTQYNFGDNMINNQNHHGTPDERAAAVVRGFEVAYREGKSLNDAVQASINYVARL